MSERIVFYFFYLTLFFERRRYLLQYWSEDIQALRDANKGRHFLLPLRFELVFGRKFRFVSPEFQRR